MSPGPGLGSVFGPALPVEPPRVALSLPHLLLAPVLEAALIARRAARLARLRSSGGAKLCPCPTCMHPLLPCLWHNLELCLLACSLEAFCM